MNFINFIYKVKVQLESKDSELSIYMSLFNKNIYHLNICINFYQIINYMMGIIKVHIP